MLELTLAAALVAAFAALVIAVRSARRGGEVEALRGQLLDALERSGERTERAVREEAGRGRDEARESAKGLREEVSSHVLKLTEMNERKLAEIRRTVDEQLQGTLEKRLAEAFRQVSDRLEHVHRGLGEMQSLAAGVGDLKRILSNVKTRGTWGEIQLGALLEQILAPEQYEENVAPRPGSGERVEYAIKLPGRELDGDAEVWLPIDAKFPREDYERLLDAEERADPAGVEAAAKALEARIKASAAEIREKYVDPPHTTDFAILFLPTEGLYAELLRRPGLADGLQREQRVVVAGPTTLAALLNSLQIGFRTLAIQRRSSEVWNLLGAVRTQFGQFTGLLDKVRKRLEQASNTIDDAAKKSRTIERRLGEVESLPAGDADDLLPELEPGPDEPEANA
jgi:DNA recombination protein RmuC